MISYLSVRENNYVPLEDIVDDLAFTDISSIDLTELSKMPLSANAISGANKLIEQINSYTTRSARKEMFQALDIMFSFDKVATIDRICPQQKYPDANKRLKDIKRDIPLFNEEKSVSEIWDSLLKHKEQIAIIIDEYGGFQGILTLEDIIETILGLEIIDENDEVSDMQQFARERWKQRQRRFKSIRLPEDEENGEQESES